VNNFGDDTLPSAGKRPVTPIIRSQKCGYRTNLNPNFSASLIVKRTNLVKKTKEGSFNKNTNPFNIIELMDCEQFGTHCAYINDHNQREFSSPTEFVLLQKDQGAWICHSNQTPLLPSRRPDQCHAAPWPLPL
jgi:hypothetical protein